MVKIGNRVVVELRREDSFAGRKGRREKSKEISGIEIWSSDSAVWAVVLLYLTRELECRSSYSSRSTAS